MTQASPSRERKAHALTLWRDGHSQLVERRVHWQRQAQYDAAISAAVSLLQVYTTFDELVTSYFANAVDDACQSACDATGTVLNAGLVEDAAYWARSQQLQSASRG